MANTLGEIRKAITLDTASDISKIMKMFAQICNDNPEAIKAAFGAYLKRGDDMSQSRMVAFYEDNAKYLAELFEVR